MEEGFPPLGRGGPPNCLAAPSSSNCLAAVWFKSAVEHREVTFGNGGFGVFRGLTVVLIGKTQNRKNSGSQFIGGGWRRAAIDVVILLAGESLSVRTPSDFVAPSRCRLLPWPDPPKLNPTT